MSYEKSEKRKEYIRSWRAANPDRLKSYSAKNYQKAKSAHRERTRAWAKANPEKWAGYMRKSQIKRKYGLTPDQFDALLVKQSGRCGCCGENPKATLHIDHNHETGIVRGLLCTNCNTMIGLAKERADTLRAAIRYLEENNNVL